MCWLRLRCCCNHWRQRCFGMRLTGMRCPWSSVGSRRVGEASRRRVLTSSPSEELSFSLHKHAQKEYGFSSGRFPANLHGSVHTPQHAVDVFRSSESGEGVGREGKLAEIEMFWGHHQFGVSGGGKLSKIEMFWGRHQQRSEWPPKCERHSTPIDANVC